jgi:hypothetical protein
MGSIMSISSLRKVISGIFSMENILTVIQIQQCLSLNSISVNSHDNGEHVLDDMNSMLITFLWSRFDSCPSSA